MKASKEVIDEYQKSIDSINGSVVQAYKTLNALKDDTYVKQSLPKMGILIEIKQSWQRDCLKDLFGEEGLNRLSHQHDKDYELELLVRRRHV